MIRIYGFTFAILMFMFVVSLLVLAAGTRSHFRGVGEKQTIVADTLVEIPLGSSLRRVSEILKTHNIIEDVSSFYWYLRLGRNDGSKIQAGYYHFNGEILASQVAERLLLGKDQSYKLTFKEGQSLVDLANALESLGLATKAEFVAAMTDEEVLKMVGAPRAGERRFLENDVGGIEGYLFPDTYFFSKSDGAIGAIKKMHAKLLSVLDAEMMAKMRENGQTLHEVLTMASIIEKETGDPSERSVISSVYNNRLKLGMRLQADPTVIYGIKDYDGKIRKADLLGYHSYNTYRIAGLPPGPIAAPGLLAIRAAIWPQDSKYLYFVSKNDGSHIFCENIICHNQAVKKWQIDYFRKAAK